MKFNIDNLEKYRNNILKKKRGYRLDNNISIYFMAGTWIFAVRNRIRIREENWEVFKGRVIKEEY
ncbi:hypothetical protein [Fusobacterium mortiferum]|uniref:Uncharacterized protein n=1 Tax=Fusobacterium mortiferum ATCC 9817 TaxID=469616 RepID=A0ABM6TXU8_FUSMR|nr:hypothetical protein [Fusobacterium mortiferum]AVQ19232.1 hypothetical protein C4N19_09060 [Fusobacterium mortiferum ATCC 9817]EEO36365.1 hypothetical protein FMAG_01927 [Fusobacterium mortiferum ATCC 9817]